MQSNKKLQEKIEAIKAGNKPTVSEYIELIKPMIQYQVSYILNEGLLKNDSKIIENLFKTLTDIRKELEQKNEDIHRP